MDSLSMSERERKREGHLPIKDAPFAVVGSLRREDQGLFSG